MNDDQIPFDFDGARSRRERDDGMRRALTPAEDWLPLALVAFDRFAAVWRGPFIGEEFRQWWSLHGAYVRPRHHNAWGALTNTLAKRARIRRTGRVRAAAAVRSHARKMLEWEILR